MPTIPRHAFVLSLLGSYSFALPALAQCPTVWLPGEVVAGVHFTPAYASNQFQSTGTDVTVSTTWDPDGAGPLPARVVLGGSFDRAGAVPAQRMAAWDGAAWSALDLAGFETPDALAAGPNGELFVAVDLHLGGSRKVLQWSGTSWVNRGIAAGSVDALVVLPSGDLVIAGAFASVGGVPALRIAKWDGSTWAPLGLGIGGSSYSNVLAMAVLPNGDLVASGLFSSAGSASVSNVARWDGTSWFAMGQGLPGLVQVLVGPNGSLYASNGSIWRWTGSTWLPVPAPPGTRWLVAVMPNGDLVVNSFSPQILERLQGGIWSPIASSFGGHATSEAIHTVAQLPNGDLVAAGRFTSVEGVGVANVARWDGSVWSALTGGTNQTVHALHVRPDGGLVASGVFTAIGGVTANYVAAAGAAAWSPLGSGMNHGIAEHNGVFALATLQNGNLVAGGSYLEAGNVPANLIAQWDGTSWSPVGTGMNWAIWALAVLANGDLIAGGGFTQAGGVAAASIARWDGAAWSPLGNGIQHFGPDTGVRALAVMPGGDIIAAGRLGYAGATYLYNIARWDGGAWSNLGSFGLQTQSSGPGVTALLALDNGDLVAGGDIAYPYPYIVRWDGINWHPLGSGTDGPVRALVQLPNGDLIAGGRFTMAGGVAASNIARWDGALWSAVGAGVNEEVRSLALLPNGDLAVGGRFTLAGGAPSAFFARLSTTCPAAAVPIATTCVGPLGPVTLMADTLPWVGATFRSTASGFAANSLAVSLLGLSSPNVPLTWLWSNTGPGCNQLASQDAILLHLPQAGSASYDFAIPNDVVFAGLPLFHQFLQFEVSAQNQLTTLSSSNGLALTIGAF